MRQSWWKTHHWLATLVLMSLMLGASCDQLPDNYWAFKWGEIINRSIFGAINAILAAATGGFVQI